MFTNSIKVKGLENLLREYEELPEFMGMTLTTANQQGGFGSTPLHIAIYRENLNEVRILLAAGADPNAPGEYGERPLQVAVHKRNEEIIELLLRSGARCDLKDEHGINAWNVADDQDYKSKLEEIVSRLTACK